MFGDTDGRLLFLHRLTKKTCALQEISAGTKTIKKKQRLGNRRLLLGHRRLACKCSFTSKFWPEVLAKKKKKES